MMPLKTLSKTVLLSVIVLQLISGCSSPTQNKEQTENKLEQATPLEKFIAAANSNKESLNLFQFNIETDTLSFKIPALQSCATATYNGLWIFIGGRKAGLHGFTNSPPPFKTVTANDSIWVVDLQNATVTGVPVPTIYASYLSATNQANYQVGDNLYLCGGYTALSKGSTSFNTTSDYFFEINLPALVQYVQSGGATPVLNQVFTKVIQSPYVQVTGGQMMVVNNNYYLIGGQNYNGVYTVGLNGQYTNAIRKFTLDSSNNVWSIADTASLMDTVNLHRRDLNLVPVIANGNDSILATIYGGVFTKKDLAYLNPVYISGLDAGKPAIKADTVQQKVNQYSCATISVGYKNENIIYNQSAFLGGITYMQYDTAEQKLVIGDGISAMPFSNLISSMFTDGSTFSYEDVQLPPQQMLPGYLGSNATFFPLPQYLMDNNSNVLDLKKIFGNSTTESVFIGYMYGGIQSDAATSFSPVKSFKTYANTTLYKVFISMP